MQRTHIIIHHSAGNDNKILRDWEGIRDYHLSKGWQDIGYNFGIEFQSDLVIVNKGRSLDISGAHCPAEGMNRKAIGICVLGNFEKAPPSPLLLPPLVHLCSKLCREHGIHPDNILPHSALMPTCCPGKFFPLDYIKDLIVAELEKEGQ